MERCRFSCCVVTGEHVTVHKICEHLHIFSPTDRFTSKAECMGVLEHLECWQVAIGALLIMDQYYKGDSIRLCPSQHHCGSALGHIARGRGIHKCNVSCKLTLLGQLHIGGHHKNCPNRYCCHRAALTRVPGK